MALVLPCSMEVDDEDTHETRDEDTHETRDEDTKRKLTIDVKPHETKKRPNGQDPYKLKADKMPKRV